MSRISILTAVALLAMVGSSLSCSKNCKTDGAGHECKISKRSVKAAIREVQELLLSFDERLKEELTNELAALNLTDKQEFLQDMQAMNAAVEIEYNSLRGAESDMSLQEIIETVANKVTEDFKEKRWYQRLQSLAGAKIANLVKNGI